MTSEHRANFLKRFERRQRRRGDKKKVRIELSWAGEGQGLTLQNEGFANISLNIVKS